MQCYDILNATFNQIENLYPAFASTIIRNLHKVKLSGDFGNITDNLEGCASEV